MLINNERRNINMKVSDTFKREVEKKDIRGIRIILKDSLLLDPSFKQFNAMNEYAEAHIPDLYDKHDSRPLDNDTSHWNDDYMNKEMVRAVGNFSRERIALLKKLVSHHDNNKSNNDDKAITHASDDHLIKSKSSDPAIAKIQDEMNDILTETKKRVLADTSKDAYAKVTRNDYNGFLQNVKRMEEILTHANIDNFSGNDMNHAAQLARLASELSSGIISISHMCRKANVGTVKESLLTDDEEPLYPSLITNESYCRCLESELFYMDVFSDEDSPALEGFDIKEKAKNFFEMIKKIFANIIAAFKRFFERIFGAGNVEMHKNAWEYGRSKCEALMSQAMQLATR